MAYFGGSRPLRMGRCLRSQAAQEVLKRNTVYDSGLGRVQTARPARQFCLCGLSPQSDQQAKGRLWQTGCGIRLLLPPKQTFQGGRGAGGGRQRDRQLRCNDRNNNGNSLGEGAWDQVPDFCAGQTNEAEGLGLGAH